MVCVVKLYEKPALNNPVLIEGLPGIGFVSNIAVLHLIQELKAKLFGKIRCSSLQDLAITAEKGKIRSPINELYYHKKKDVGRDLLLLYGNTQALTTPGQYNLCGKILDIAEEMGCHQIITLGGLKREGTIDTPKLYYAASDLRTLQALNFDATIISGHIFGVAGLLIGLGKLRGMSGLCILSETPGYPDVSAAREVLNVVCELLQLNVDLARLDTAAEETRNMLESFGLTTSPTEEKEKEESRSRWFI